MKIRLKLDKEFHLIDPVFFKKRSRYFFQSILASTALLIVLIIGDNFAQGAIIAGIAGTTALISFAPHSYAANTRRVVGGHFLSVLVGSLSIFLLSLFSVDYNSASEWIIYLNSSISIGVLIILMGVLNCEHAPSAGCLLGLTYGGVDLNSVAFIMSSAIVLSLIRMLLLKWIKNLV
jgi:CBS-domain-containing membrane protein